MSIVLIDDRRNGEAVRITAADWNGSSFDGCPFSATPEWLKAAIKSAAVLPFGSDRDYALWRVETRDGKTVIAEPDDWIMYEAGKGLRVYKMA
jgi:hypothetical protein